MEQFYSWFKNLTKKDFADLDFEILDKRNEPYSRLQLMKELRLDLLQINDLINFHILKTKLIKRAKSDVYDEIIRTRGTLFGWFDKDEIRQATAKLTLIDADKKSKFFFRINDFWDSSNGLRLNITLFPRDKNFLSQYERENIDIFEFENLFNNWINNVKLYNNFKIEDYKKDEPIEANLFFSPNTTDEEKLNENEIKQIETFLIDLKTVVLTKENRQNSDNIKRIIFDIEYLKENLANFNKNKVRFYLNNLGKKVFWFIKEMTFELIKEVVTRSLLGPG